MRFRDESHPSDVFSPKEFYISFFIEGIKFAHWICLEDKKEIWLTKTLFRCFTSSRLLFIVLSDSRYCCTCSLRSFISCSFLCIWAVSILSFIVTCILFLKEIKKSDLCCQFSWIFDNLFCVCIDYLLIIFFTPFFVYLLGFIYHTVNVLYSILFLHPSSVGDIVSA